MPSREDNLVTVCRACGRASCWQGKALCEDSRMADTKQVTVRELRLLNLEHQRYWTKACEEGVA